MRYEDEPVALTDGQWVLDPKTRVLRWVAAPGPEPTDLCPTCNAKPWEPCRSRNGRRDRNHKQRPGPQVCRCGGELTRGSNQCRPCLLENAGRRKSRLEVSDAA